MTTQTPLQSIQTPDLMQERLVRLKAEFPDLFTSEGQINPEELLRLTGQQGRERFDFSWWGKSQAKRNAFSPTTAALRYDAARSVNPDKAGGNAIIEGENLEVLKLLLCAYRGQVKCIYIDPPYNTGNDFVYSDHFAEGERAYWEQTGITEGGVKMSTNTRSDGRFHSKWLNMIYPRLLVARQLLREDGVIFVSIDDNEVTHLRKVMDEVFGEENFVACFCWKSRQNKDNRNKTGVSIDHEYVLCYSSTTEFKALKGENRDSSGYTNHDGDSRGAWTSANMVGLLPKEQRPNCHYDLIDPSTGINYGKPKLGWRYDKKTMNRLISEQRILWPASSEGRPRRKLFLSELTQETTGFTSVIGNEVYTRDGTSLIDEIFGEKYFEFPKPLDLVIQLVSQVTDSDKAHIVLDFFVGSATTPHAVISLNESDGGNRRYIGVQIPEATDERSSAGQAGFKKISDITIERVKHVIQGYGENPQPIDAGFKVFTLQKSAFPRADFAPDPDATEADQLAALKAFIADKEASLFNTLDPQAVRDEVLLKCGFQLDVQLTPITEVTANQLYHARDQQTPPREAIVCIDSHLDTTTLEWLRQQKGQRVIVLEAALDTTGKWNLHHQLGDGLVVF